MASAETELASRRSLDLSLGRGGACEGCWTREDLSSVGARHFSTKLETVMADSRGYLFLVHLAAPFKFSP